MLRSYPCSAIVRKPNIRAGAISDRSRYRFFSFSPLSQVLLYSGRFAVPDEENRRTQTDPGSHIIEHLLEFLPAHTDALSSFGRITIIEGDMILSDTCHHNPVRNVQLVHHPH